MLFSFLSTVPSEAHLFQPFLGDTERCNASVGEIQRSFVIPRVADTHGRVVQNHGFYRSRAWVHLDAFAFAATRNFARLISD